MSAYTASDSSRSLLDSGEFRYFQDLQEIRVNGKPYWRDMLIAPSPEGHSVSKLQFIRADGNNIHPASSTRNSHAPMRRDGIIEAAPHPEGDKTIWTLNSESGSIDVVVELPRIWWRLNSGGTQSDEWRDTPLAMTREEFRGYAGADAVMQLRLPPHIQSVSAGFGDGLNRSFRVKDRLPLKDFADYAEIDNPLNEDALLRVQCDEKTILTLIRVAADPAPPPPDTPPEPPLPEDRLYALVKRRGVGLRPGKGFSRGELRDAGMTNAEAKRLSIRIDRRRKSTHRHNIDRLNKIENHA